MIVILHVVIALLSIVCTTLGYARPTKTNIRISYALAALTLMSGFYLVAAEPAQMLRTCMTGVAYLAVVSVGILAARRKLNALQSEQA